MSQSGSSFDALLRTLKIRPDQISEMELCDALWLALRLPAPEDPVQQPEERMDPLREAPAEIRPAHETHEPSPKPTPEALAAPGSTPMPASAMLESPSRTKVSTGLMFRTPGASALPGETALALARALRPFRRRVGSRWRFELDEQATARRISEERAWRSAPPGTWLPARRRVVLRPQKVRWFDVAVVVDGAASMAIWERTIREFVQVLAHLGAFRDVRTWTLDTEDPDLHLHAGVTSRRDWPRGVREVVDPTGQRVILVLTDGVAAAWRDGRAPAALGEWATRTPTAIVGVLPERLWAGTVLQALPQVTIRTYRSSETRVTLAAETDDHGPDCDKEDEEASKTAMMHPIPVSSMTPSSLTTLARMLTGAGRGRAVIPRLVAGPAHGAASQPELDSSERVRRFDSMVSPTAVHLARLFAVTPPFLPVMRLVQHTVLPNSTQEHLAEVFLGGLLEEATGKERLEGEEVEYRFRPGVAETLRRSRSDLADVMAVMRTVSRYVTQRLGKPLDFGAVLADPTAKLPDGLSTDRVGEAFARIAAEVLRPLGGDYAALAERLSRVLSQNENGELHSTSSSDGRQPPEIVSSNAFDSSHFRQSLLRERPMLVQAVRRALEDVTLNVREADDFVVDIEVADLTLDIGDIEVYEHESSALVELSGTAVLHGSFNRPDYDNATYDSEDGVFHNLDTLSETAAFEVFWTAQAEFWSDSETVHLLSDILSFDVDPSDFSYSDLTIVHEESTFLDEDDDRERSDGDGLPEPYGEPPDLDAPSDKTDAPQIDEPSGVDDGQPDVGPFAMVDGQPGVDPLLVDAAAVSEASTRTVVLHLNIGDRNDSGSRSLSAQEAHDLANSPDAIYYSVERRIDRKAMTARQWREVAKDIDAVLARVRSDVTVKGPVQIVIVGQAPLPVFAYLGHQMRRERGKILLINHRQGSAIWDRIGPPETGALGDDPFVVKKPPLGRERQGKVILSILCSNEYSYNDDMVEPMLKAEGASLLCSYQIRHTQSHRDAPMTRHDLAILVRHVEEALVWIKDECPATAGLVVALGGPSWVAFWVANLINLSANGRIDYPNLLPGRGYVRALSAPMHEAPWFTARAKLLILASDPDNQFSVSVSRATDAIQEALARRLGPNGPYEIRTRRVTKVVDIMQEIEHFKPEILHIQLHGSPSGDLTFEDENEETKQVTGEGFVALLAATEVKPALIVLNSCHSSVIAPLLAEIAECVIAMNETMEVKATITFSMGFYEALGRGHHLAKAIEHGRALTRAEHSTGDAQMALLCGPDVNATEIILFPPRPARGGLNHAFGESEQGSRWTEASRIGRPRPTTHSKPEAAMQSIAQAFGTFLLQLELTDTERANASAHHGELREQLRRRLGVQDSFLTGSYARGTAVRPLDEIDVFLVLAPSRTLNSSTQPKQVLAEMQRALETVYVGNTTTKQARSVNIKFSRTGIGYEVIPAFSSDNKTFRIPDIEASGWMLTNPGVHASMSTEANERAGKKLKPLLKAVKQVNRCRDDPAPSFHLEVLAWKVLNRDPGSYIDGLAILLEGLAARVCDPCPDPAGLGGEIGPSLARCKSAARWFGEIAKLVRGARQLASEGRTGESHAKLREALGETWPE